MSPETVHIMAMTHSCSRRWDRVSHPNGAWSAYVEIGSLPDSRWYVWVTAQQADNQARLYPDEESARTVAQRWMDRIGGRWAQIPCDSYSKRWRPDEREGS